MKQRVFLSIALTALAILLLGAYMAVEPQRQTLAAQRQRHEAVARGMSLFAGRCSGCHGARGEGKVGPSLARDAYLDRHNIKQDASSLRMAQTEIEKTIARGVKRTAMPAWAVEEGGSMNQEQILEIASFLLYGSEEDWRAAVSLAAPPPAASQPPSSSAAPDPVAQGRLVYQSKGCIACHGPNAEGMLGPALAGFKEEQIARQLRTPRGAMPAFPPDRLSDAELRALVAYVESLTKK